MTPFVKFLFRLLLFWMGFFLLSRLIEFLAFFSLIQAEDLTSKLRVFYSGFRLDFATIGYFLILPLFLGIIGSLFKSTVFQRFLFRLTDAVSVMIIVLTSLLCSAELSTYLDWRSKVNGRLFFYLDHLGEGLRSATALHLTLFLAPLVVLGLGGIWVYFKWIRLSAPLSSPETWKTKSQRLGLGFIATALCALAIRGNLSAIPINSSEAYFSSNTTLNDITTNTVWNFVSSSVEYFRAGRENPYAELPQSELNATMQGIYTAPTLGFPLVLKNQRPDIVLIIQEGISADMVGALGGYEGVTPVYDQLAQEGLLFTKLYSSGWTSDVGHLSILSGFPALPQANPINRSEKSRSLPSVIQSLKKAGYRVNYYYGGDSNYGHIRGYLLDHGADKVVDETELKLPVEKGRLGYHDDAMYNYLAGQVASADTPACHIFFTLSTHTPYDFNHGVSLDYQGIQEDYARATFFSDSCLGVFVQNLKQTSRWDNTLLMMIPDHSNNAVVQRRAVEHERYRIGWLMTGGVMKDEYCGVQVNKLGSQLDFAATLLPQLGMSADSFRWSKNLLAEGCPEFATYVFPSGHGWMRPGGSYVFEYNLRVNHEEEFPIPEARDSIIREGKAFLQAAQQAYLDL